MSGLCKPIEAVVEKGPNYVFHLMAVAGVGFDSDYGERYRHTVADEDRSLLSGMRELLSFLDDQSGPLVTPALFLPAYMNLDTAEAFSDYFGRLERGISEPEVFLSYYEPFLRKLGDNWLQVFDERWLGMGRGLEKTLNRLGELYVRNYAPFCATVWPSERPGTASVASRINRYFRGRDIIGDWERFTGVQWKTDRYQIVLVSAIKDGPRANSLGYDRNVFYAYEDFESMVRFISHETGTHLLIDVIKAFTRPDSDRRVRLRVGGTDRVSYDFGLIYRGYENLCRFYNGLIFGLEDLNGMGQDYRSEESQTLYQDLYAHKPGAGPLEMLLYAVGQLGERGS